MCDEDICFNCDIREDCDHVNHRYVFWDGHCRKAIMKEYNSQSIAEIAYDKLFDKFRGRR